MKKELDLLGIIYNPYMNNIQSQPVCEDWRIHRITSELLNIPVKGVNQDEGNNNVINRQKF